MSIVFILRGNIVSRSIKKYRTRIFQTYVLIAVASFSVLAIVVRFTPYFSLDLKMSNVVQSFNPFWFDALMKFVSFPGNFPESYVILTVPVIILFLYKLRWEALSAALSALSVTLASAVIKTTIARARPAQDLIKVFLPLHDPSFPSDHVFTYTAYFGFLAYLVYALLPKSRTRSVLLTLLTLLILLIGLSRIYLGEHWPSDTLGAYLIGSVWIFFMIQFYRWGRKKFFVSPESTPEAIKEVRSTNST